MLAGLGKYEKCLVIINGRKRRKGRKQTILVHVLFHIFSVVKEIKQYYCIFLYIFFIWTTNWSIRIRGDVRNELLIVL